MQHKRRTDGAAAGAEEQVPAIPESDVVEELETSARITETWCFAANMPDANAGDDKDERRRKTNGSAASPHVPSHACSPRLPLHLLFLPERRQHFWFDCVST